MMEQIKLAILGWFIGSGIAAHIIIIKDFIKLIIKERKSKIKEKRKYEYEKNK